MKSVTISRQQSSRVRCIAFGPGDIYTVYMPEESSKLCLSVRGNARVKVVSSVSVCVKVLVDDDAVAVIDVGARSKVRAFVHARSSLCVLAGADCSLYARRNKDAHMVVKCPRLLTNDVCEIVGRVTDDDDN